MTRNYIASIMCAFALAACSGGGVKETLGLESKAPDEFKVVSRPPLSVPPQFSLRPPAVGDNSANPYATDKQAESLVTGKPVDASGGETFVLKNSEAPATAVHPVESNPINAIAGSSAESQFLQKAGAHEVDPGVRKELVEERIVKQEAKEDASWWDWTAYAPEKKETVVDAKKESERIEKNKEEGKPVNEGETATIKPKDRGVLGYILGD